MWKWLERYANKMVVLLQLKRLGDWIDQYWLACAWAECVQTANNRNWRSEWDGVECAPVVMVEEVTEEAVEALSLTGPLMTVCTRCTWDTMPEVRR